ncbi:protein BCAP isoform X3 [Tiliqua scincoides]|uniref:protein BCAP isoform X3 n=1 Tax=Tiliqua scincoides TaxID=71010 RepID=UPI003461CDE9
MEESGKEEELFLSNSFTSTSDYHVQRRRLCSPGIGEESSQKSSLPEYTEREPLEENGSSYKLANKHRTRIKELMPCLKEKSQDTLLEGSLSNSETKWWWEDARIEEAAFRKKLQEAELAIGSAEMFLPSFKETISRVTQINTKLVEDLIWKLTEVDTEISGLKSEVLQKERHILQLSAQLQQEKTNLLKASDQSDSIQSVQTHLQCQIEKKETENNQLRTKLQSIEKKIAEWKLQIAECKQQILTEKERKEERKNALKRAASVQKQRAERLGAAVETTTLKIREKEIQLSEALSASNIWKSRHEMVVDEKTRLEVQVETLKKQMRGHLTELQRIQNDERKSKREILGKLNSVISENETISLENAKLKTSAAALEVNIISAEAELADLREEAKRQENLVEQYRSEVGKLETEAEELKIRYEKVIRESRKVTEVKDLEMDTMKDQTESRLKDLEHVRDLQKAAEEKLRECQESLLSCQKSCVDKSKAIRELQVQADNDNSFLKQHYIEERNYNIKMKYEEVQRKLEEMESENKELENQLADQEENLQKTELQFKQKVANYDALTRQLEVALEDGRKKLAEEEEKMKSKERLLQLKMLDLENELRQKKEEHKRLARKLNTNAKRREVHLKELEHSLQKSENQNQSIHNYVQFLKTSYVTMFG